jgi:hypothetical protein
MENYRFHDQRLTTYTRPLNEGKSLFAVMQISRHASYMFKAYFSLNEMIAAQSIKFGASL